MQQPYLADPQRTAAVINRYEFAFQKRFGQNFLIDSQVLERIMDAAEVGKDDFVLEIGPGIGTMTQYLASRARKVIAVEIDRNLIPILGDTLNGWDNVSIIQGDILKVNLAELIEKENEGRPIKVVANLPYYITTPILMKLLESGLPIDNITVMVQTEVAERMQAGPGTKAYGALSLSVQYYADPYIAVYVPPHCFMPRPGVGSSVLCLKKREQPPVEVKDPQRMFALIKASFLQRRKTLVNGLNGCKELGLSKDQVQQALRTLGWSETIRGEALTLAEFAELSDQLPAEK